MATWALELVRTVSVMEGVEVSKKLGKDVFTCSHCFDGRQNDFAIVKHSDVGGILLMNEGGGEEFNFIKEASIAPRNLL